MRIIKQFNFRGYFKKAEVENQNLTEEFEATIHCYANGQVLLETDVEVLKIICEKAFLEMEPMYKLPESSQPQNLNSIQALNPEKILVKPAYKGKFEIKGLTSDNSSLSAIVILNSSHPSNLILNDLRINHEYLQKETQTRSVKYGLTDLSLISKFSLPFLISTSSLTISPISIEEQQNHLDSTLTAELTLSNFEETQNLNCDLYACWLELVLAFAAGDHIKRIYEIQHLECDGQTQEAELWPGRKPEAKTTGLQVIQQPHIPVFLQQVLEHVTYKNFVDNGIGLSLSWYVETFDTNVLSSKFVLLCTAFETLNEKFKTNLSSRLVSRSVYRNLKEKFIRFLEETKADLPQEENAEKYDIFHNKIINSLEDWSLNKVGPLGTSLKAMLDHYSVKYDDLLPNFNFIQIRNDVIHRGFSDSDTMFDCYLKLDNLYVRLILSMLKYGGDFMEHYDCELICRNLSSMHTV